MGTGSQVRSMEMREPGTTAAAAMNSTSGRRTVFPQLTRSILVKLKDLRDVKGSSVEIMPVETDMMEFAIRMVVTSIHGGWETKPFTDLVQILRSTRHRR